MHVEAYRSIKLLVNHRLTSEQLHSHYNSDLVERQNVRPNRLQTDQQISMLVCLNLLSSRFRYFLLSAADANTLSLVLCLFLSFSR